MPVVLLDFKPLVRNSLRGFAKIRLGLSLIICDVPVCSAHGKHWVVLPPKPLVDCDGTALRDNSGKVKHAPILEWTERTACDAFPRAVVEVVARAHSETFAEEAVLP
jgi:hypothetical protein